MHYRRILQSYAPIFVVGMVLCSVVNADPMYHVSVDTSALNGKGTFYVEFQLVDGSSVGGDGDALAIVRNFSTTGMSLGQVLEPTFGNVSGALTGILTL